MSVRPKYFYKLSIYDSEAISEKENIQPPKEWNFQLGLGERIMGLAASSMNTQKNIQVKATDVKEYASTMEGRLKLGFIGSCTCLGGIVTLVRKPRGLLRKLAYPVGFLGVSSTICYPSKAYLISKICAVNLATGLYTSAKFTSAKVSSILEERRIKEEKRRAEEEVKKAEEEEKRRKEEQKKREEEAIREREERERIKDEEKRREEDRIDEEVEQERRAGVEEMMQEEASVDLAPILNAPVSDDKLSKEESLFIKSNLPEEAPNREKLPEVSIFTTQPFEDEKLPEMIQKAGNEESEKESQDSLLDFGQSSKEDTDLYTTRS